ncbi:MULTISPECIES: three-Cys-motif partner protein TcmP [unclassified Desulfovibrio]|uniref:three-Cys-motif partner protein TcmP n=1 Tax=unclassified Desulfovibrio TaxID=2593640 RepID=UPI002FD89F70
MSSKPDFHEEPFDDGTILKLEILESCLTGWLPVFLNHPYISYIYIYDFYCGPGQDIKNIPGSPVRIYNALNKYGSLLSKKKIHVCLNDADPLKVNACNLIKKPENITCHFTNKSADECFKALMPRSFPNNSAHFFYIDPCGIVDYQMVLSTVNAIKAADTLLFIPASFINRFYEQDGFAARLPNFPRGIKPKEITKIFCRYCKEEFGFNETYFAPFSIKKTKSHQVHGLVFMTRHPLGLEKFLSATWNNSVNGESNFTLTGDMPENDQHFLDETFSMTSKIPVFQRTLKEKILAKEITTNRGVYIFTVTHGHIIKHASSVISELLKEKKIRKKVSISNKYALSNNIETIELV